MNMSESYVKRNGEKKIGNIYIYIYIYIYTCYKVAKAVKQCSIHFLSVEL